MTRFNERYETPKWRTFWLLLGFALLVTIGIVTVWLPELEDEPEESPVAETEPGTVQRPSDSAQE